MKIIRKESNVFKLPKHTNKILWPKKLSINRRKLEKIYKGKSTSSHILVRPLDFQTGWIHFQSSITGEKFKTCKSDDSGKESEKFVI